MTTETIIANTKQMIDDLKTVCANFGLGNASSEYKIITEIFLYKFLNDKFLYEVQQAEESLKDSDNVEQALNDMSEDDYEMLMMLLPPATAKLKKEHFISYLFNHKNDDKFNELFDSTLWDISNTNLDVFSVSTGSGDKIRLFDEHLSQNVTESNRRSDFCKAMIDKLVTFSFADAFSQKYDFFATIFEYLIKDYNKDFGKYAEYYTPHSIASIIARIMVPEGTQNVTVYDPAAGSGTLVLALAHEIGESNCTIYTQDMKEKLISEIMKEMLPSLDNEQLKKLKDTLEVHFYNVSIISRKETAIEKEELDYLAVFLSAKRIEGCSEKTLLYYKSTIQQMLESVGKSVCTIVTEDLRSYLAEYQCKKEASKVTIDNIRRIFSSFFAWLEDEDYIIKSPVRRIHRIKAASTIKETYTDEQLESMRDNCDNLRDLALIDILASTGMRVGELVLLNKDDISFDERECVVFGKGDKERMVYFDARTKIHLQNYLDSRSDSNEALFVSLKAPYNRMKIGGIELRLREMGRKLNIEKVHPHKFRRTLATVAIDKGMPIEQLQKLLGHQRIDTTLQYAMVKQSNVKFAHRKYIG